MGKGTQIIHLTGKSNTLDGKILQESDDVFVRCDTSTAPFSVQIPIANVTTYKKIILKNAGSNQVTFNFYASSRLYYYDVSTTSVTLASGKALTIVNDVLNNKWYSLDSDYDRFGSQTSYAEFESDGTLKLYGDATGWKDIFFPMAIPKAVGVGNPTLTTWNTIFKNYAFAINDAHDFDAQEFDHAGKVSAITGQFHIHFVSLTNVAADRYVKWQLDYSQANHLGVFPTTTTISSEYTIPANTTVNTHILFNIGNPFTTLNPGSVMVLRLTRIAASGTAPATDPVVLGIHYHYEVDSLGSHTITTK